MERQSVSIQQMVATLHRYTIASEPAKSCLCIDNVLLVSHPAAASVLPVSSQCIACEPASGYQCIASVLLVSQLAVARVLPVYC